MNEIHFIHGCASSWHANLQVVRNYVPEDSLKRHLLERDIPYGPLSESDEYDALTVDDSTNGAARSCVLARETGHEVTLFINPAQIERRRTYWSGLFDAIVDDRRVETTTFEGQRFSLSPGQPLREFRLAVKDRLMAMAEEDVDAILDDLAVSLKVQRVAVPEHARTLTLDAVTDLVSRGVSIGSHGWDHRDTAAMKPEEVIDDLRRAQAWFQSTLGISPAHYAVPYGKVFLPPEAVEEIEGMILLDNPALDMGPLGQKHWNRRAITRDLQGLVP
jgi:hypothetical protein